MITLKILHNSVNGDDDNFQLNLNFISSTNEDLNRIFFSEEEVLKAIKSFKNNKSCGNDYMLNDFLKCAEDKMLKCFCKISNIKFETGIVPESWFVGIICPIYKKNKGDVGNPDNYIGVTILNCFGKLFTAAAVLNSDWMLILKRWM